MDRWLEQRRVLLTAGYAVVAGVWVYLAVRVGSGLEGGWIAFAVLTILVGAAVRRWWVVLSVAGPIAGLAIVEQTSNFGQGDWPDLFILSPPTWFYAVLIATALLLGCAIGEGLAWVGDVHRSRPDR